MGKYKDLTESFYEDYEQPVIEDYIVGFSGLDPDRKIKPETIDHEKLDGLLGGDFSGRYHLTNDQVRKFTGYQGQIDKNKEDSETALTKLRTDTDNAVTTLRKDTNQAISQLRQDSETSDREIRHETQASIQNLNMDLQTAKSVMGLQVSQISQRQEAVEGTQANISARFDEALEGVTEDSEVIDARVDAENIRHVNLGANVRSLHRRVISADKISHERDGALHNHFQEQADELAGEVLRHTLEIDANEKRISSSEAEIAFTGERLSEEIQTRLKETETRKNEDDDIRQELRQSISQARKDTASRSENLQEQADTLAGEVLCLEFQRQEDISRHGKDIEALRLGIMLARKLSASRHDHLQEQSDDLAGTLLDNTVETYRLGEKLKDETEYRKSDTRYLTGEIASEARERLLSDEALNDDMYAEYETRRKADEELRTDISASRHQTLAVYEHLCEEADTLSGEILRQKLEHEADREQTAQELRGLEERTAGKIVHEQRQRTAYDEHLQEQANDLAQAELTTAKNLIEESRKREETEEAARKEISKERAERQETEAEIRCEISAGRKQTQAVHEELSEQAGEMAGEILSLNIQRKRDTEQTEQSIAQECNERRKLELSLKEQISYWERKSTEAEKRLREGLLEVSELAIETAADNAASILRVAFHVIETARRQKTYQAAIQEEEKARSQRIYDWISGLQEQINELAYLKLSDLKASYEVDGRLSVIEGELDAVMSEIDPDGTAADESADEAIEDAFSTDTAVEVEPEFTEMLDEIFGVNP